MLSVFRSNSYINLIFIDGEIILLLCRLHAINVTKRIHSNPLLPSVIEQSNLSHVSSNLYELFHPVVTVALLGDEVAADYLICHLISSIFSRQVCNFDQYFK